MNEKIEILGVNIDNLTMSQAILQVDKMVRSNSCHQIVTVNPEFLVYARKDRQFKRVLNQASLAIPDGFGLLWAARQQEKYFYERVTGADLVESLAKTQKYSFYLLGGAPGVAKTASNKWLKKYPRLKVKGADSGGIITNQNLAHQKKLVQEINQLKPDILLVALGAPKQDKFIARWQRELKCKVAIGVGGTFDYVAGNLPRAPRSWQKVRLEWLWRLLKEPWRAMRIFQATVIFPLLVILKK